eukprot:2546076-Alexandrium_andersonii.AAC.1
MHVQNLGGLMPLHVAADYAGYSRDFELTCQELVDLASPEDSPHGIAAFPHLVILGVASVFACGGRLAYSTSSCLRGLCFRRGTPVSYTHLTLPTICSV